MVSQDLLNNEYDDKYGETLGKASSTSFSHLEANKKSTKKTSAFDKISEDSAAMTTIKPKDKGILNSNSDRNNRRKRKLADQRYAVSKTLFETSKPIKIIALNDLTLSFYNVQESDAEFADQEDKVFFCQMKVYDFTPKSDSYSCQQVYNLPPGRGLVEFSLVSEVIQDYTESNIPR